MTDHRIDTRQINENLHLAALGWMHRHCREYQGNDHKLCAWAVQFLMDGHDVTQQTAENAVMRAYGDFRNHDNRCYLDLSLSTGNTLAIRDPDTDMLFVVPVSHLVDRVLPGNRKKRPPLFLVQSNIH